MNLKNKTILLISPQSWGKMQLAKHNYAIALAKNGNSVYFLNPAIKQGFNKCIKIVKADEQSNLYLINHNHHALNKVTLSRFSLFRFMMKSHISFILKAINKEVDIVWSFDLNNIYPLELFKSSKLKIFHPIDEPLTLNAINSAKGADFIFSVTKEILEKYKHFKVPKLFLHHGLSDFFLIKDAELSKSNKVKNVTVGLSGNFLRFDLDRSCLLKIISENSSVTFEFFGTYELTQSNIGGDKSRVAKEFIEKLKFLRNTKFHGVLDTASLVSEFGRMDAFLICYDINKDQSKGTNYHKVMEFLSTGKVVISNNITTYSTLDNLLEMNNSRENNFGLPILFKQVINNLEYYNSSTFIQKRRKFALSNLYCNKIVEIESFLERLK